MRANFSPAKKLIGRVVPHPAAVRAFMYQRRAHVFIMVATFLILTTLGFISVRALVATDRPAQDHNAVTKNEVKEEGTHVTTTYESPAPEAPKTDGSARNDSGAKTSVTVNNQQIPVPNNGSVSKTITNENGTTQVNISSNTSSTGGAHSSSSSSTHLNVSTNTSSDDVTFDNTTQ